MRTLLKDEDGLAVDIRVNPRARRMVLRLCPDSGTARVTLPPRTSRADAQAFIARNREWIRLQRERRAALNQPFVPGLDLPFRGGSLLLAQGSGRLARHEGGRLLVPGEGSLFAGRVRRWLTRQALVLLEAETRQLAASAGLRVTGVRVGDYRSRWGSCARDGRIAYSWRLILAPDTIRAALVAHEVAHLAHPNHGPGFWALATELLGTPHGPARAWLREHGSRLMGYGAGA